MDAAFPTILTDFGDSHLLPDQLGHWVCSPLPSNAFLALASAWWLMSTLPLCEACQRRRELSNTAASLSSLLQYSKVSPRPCCPLPMCVSKDRGLLTHAKGNVQVQTACQLPRYPAGECVCLHVLAGFNLDKTQRQVLPIFCKFYSALPNELRKDT